jgi:hypothetical protein
VASHVLNDDTDWNYAQAACGSPVSIIPMYRKRNRRRIEKGFLNIAESPPLLEKNCLSSCRGSNPTA